MKTRNYVFGIIVVLIVIIGYQEIRLNNLKREYEIGLPGGDIEKAELHDSLFNLSTELGRYEMTLEILKEEDSVAAQKFEYILTTQTE